MLVLAVVLLVGSAGPAHAKGPSQGVLDGEGLEQPIAIGYGEGTPGGDRLIEDTGFFDVTFGMLPSRTLPDAPTDDLGPRLQLTWTVPGPDGLADLIVQDVYPYAAGGPVTYTAPGQPFFERERTVGGWFRSPPRLLATLRALGLPDADALGPAAGGRGTRWAPIGGSLLAMVVLGAALVAFGRRPTRVAPAAG